MILKEIEISGFKSFANPVKMQFSYPVVAVVGPNGSGKSNVAEAFRFVLGEQSKKNMRSKTADDLIWAGNSFKAKQNRARVSIIFDNRQRIFDTDFEELKLERIIFRDGANEYYINDTQVRLKDIQELIASAKLGAGSHHIISQGEADAILNASDKERFKIIKEALGLNKYFVKLQDAKRKLSKTETNIKEGKIRMRELSPRLRFLENEIKKLEKIDTLKEELLKAYAFYIHFNKQKFDKERQELLRQLTLAKSRLDSASSALSDFQDPKADSEILRLKTRLQEIEAQERSLSDDLVNLEKAQSKTDGEIEALKYAKDESLTGASKNHSQTEEFVSLPKDFLGTFVKILQTVLKKGLDEAASDKLQSALKTLDSYIKRDSASEAESTKLPNTAIEAKIKKLADEQKTRRIAISELKESLDKLREAKANLQSRIDAKQSLSLSRETKLLQLSEQKNSAVTNYKKIEMELLRLKEEENKLKNMLKEASSMFSSTFLRLMQSLKDGSSKVEQIYKLVDIERLKIRLEELGAVDDSIIQEYKNTKERMTFLETEVVDLERSEANLLSTISELEKNIERETEKGISKIEKEFNHFFRELFPGATASVQLYKDQDKDTGEQQSAVSIDVKIPGKRLSSLSSLSGGERSLVSIALIFAISQVSPPPFIILDETDAALDEANSKKYSDILLSLAQNSQIITITHNRQTMAVSGELFGVTMGKDAVSQVLSITLQEAETVAK